MQLDAYSFMIDEQDYRIPLKRCQWDNTCVNKDDNEIVCSNNEYTCEPRYYNDVHVRRTLIRWHDYSRFCYFLVCLLPDT